VLLVGVVQIFRAQLSPTITITMPTDQPKQPPEQRPDQSLPQTFLFYNMLIDKIVKNMGRASDRKEEPEKILAEVKEQYNQRAHFAWLISATYPDQQEDKEGEGEETIARNRK